MFTWKGNCFLKPSFLETLLIPIFVLLLLSACGGGGGGGESPKPEPTTQTIHGAGVKGPLALATVTVYNIDYTQADRKGTMVAQGETNASAAITNLALPLPLNAPYLIEFSSTANTIDLTTDSTPVIPTLRTIAKDNAMLSGQIYATPHTTIATDLALNHSKNNTELLSELNIAAALVNTVLGFGMDSSIDIFTSPPLIDQTITTSDQQLKVVQYRTAIEALTAVLFNIANALSTGIEEVGNSLIADLEDGVINEMPQIAIDEFAKDPATFTIPNSTNTVDDVESILVTETATTGATAPAPNLNNSDAYSPKPADFDGDGVANNVDNCPYVSNADQADLNSNDVGDVCETQIQLSGIWRVQFTPAGSPVCNGGTTGNAQYILTMPELVSYVSISQTQNSSALTLTYHNGITVSGNINSDGTISLTQGIRSWIDAHGLQTSVKYNFSGSFISGAPDSISGSLVNDTMNGSATCTQTLDFTAEHVYSHTGNENYNGVYQIEWKSTNDVNAENNRESLPLEIEIADGNISIGFVDEDYLGKFLSPISFNPLTGIATYTTMQDEIGDADGDNSQDDLEHRETSVTVMFVRSDTDTSGLPTLIFTHYEWEKGYLNTTVYPPANGATQISSGNSYQQGYGRLVTQQGFTRSNHVPISGGAEANYVVLGVSHANILKLDDYELSSVDILDVADSNNVVASCGFNRYKVRTHLPFADMKSESFGNYNYSWVNCPLNPNVVINDGSYLMNVKDSTGTVQYSYPIIATPTTFADSIPSRRQINVGGALSSQTRRGDPIRLHGYFNPTQDISVTVPESSDLDLQYYRLSFADPRSSSVRGDITSTTNNFVIPANSILSYSLNEEISLNMRLSERYNRTGRIAQAHSRHLAIQAGIRALTTLELFNSNLSAPWVIQLWLRGINEVPGNVECIPARPINMLELTCNPGTLNFTNNTITVPVTAFGNSTNIVITFNDSISGTVVMQDTINGNWTGSAIIVNPELVTRTQRNADDTETTFVNFLNPIPQFSSGILTSQSGQDLGSGISTPVTLWNGNYSQIFSSFFQLPLDGIEPQNTAAYVSHNSDDVGQLFQADSFTLNTGNHTYRVDYTPVDLSAMAPPQRSDVTINTQDATTFGFNNPYELLSQPITITWIHTLSLAPENTRWELRLREVVGSGSGHVPHSEVRTKRLANGEDSLSYDLSSNTWTWTAPSNFPIPSTGVWKINLRASDALNTVRSQSAGVFVTDQTP